MTKDKPHWLAPIKEAFLVPHNQIISVYVVRCTLFSIAEFTINYAATSLINREITGVRAFSVYAVKILNIPLGIGVLSTYIFSARLGSFRS